MYDGLYAIVGNSAMHIIEITHRDNNRYPQPTTAARNQMVQILQIWASQNKEVGYRQGMHEILATIYTHYLNL